MRKNARGLWRDRDYSRFYVPTSHRLLKTGSFNNLKSCVQTCLTGLYTNKDDQLILVKLEIYIDNSFHNSYTSTSD